MNKTPKRLSHVKIAREIYDSLAGRSEKCYVTRNGRRERILEVERINGSVMVWTRTRSIKLAPKDLVTVDAGLMIESRLALAE